jgi:hypothetical protein
MCQGLIPPTSKFCTFMRRIRTVAQETHGLYFILIQAPRGSLHSVRQCVLYAQGARGRGYKPRLGEEPDPKSMWCCEAM